MRRCFIRGPSSRPRLSQDCGLWTQSQPPRPPVSPPSNEELLEFLSDNWAADFTNDNSQEQLRDKQRSKEKPQKLGSNGKPAEEDEQTPREDGQKWKNKNPASQLPQSPLMDPRLTAARLRYRERKAAPSKEPSAFQRKLRRNPYAQALATSTRHCLLTDVRLPFYFLFNFGLATHPKTGAKWHLPRLAAESKEKSRRPAKDNVDVASSITRDSPPTQPTKETSENIQPKYHPRSTIQPTDQGAPPDIQDHNSPTRRLSGTNILASRPALHYITQLNRTQYVRLLPYHWKADPGIKGSDIVWREDMDMFTLEIMRKGAARDLAYLADRKGVYITACEGYQSVEKHAAVGGVLWLGGNGRIGDGASEVGEEGAKEEDGEIANEKGEEKSKEKSPPAYAMVMYKGRYIPIYNLPVLLGHKHLGMLREKQPRQFGGHMAVLKQRDRACRAHLDLWKLVGYLATDHDSKTT